MEMWNSYRNNLPKFATLLVNYKEKQIHNFDNGEQYMHYSLLKIHKIFIFV